MMNLRRVGRTPGLRSAGLKRRRNGSYEAQPTQQAPGQQGGPDYRMSAMQQLAKPKVPAGYRPHQRAPGQNQQATPGRTGTPVNRAGGPQSSPRQSGTPGLSPYSQKPVQSASQQGAQTKDPVYYAALQQMAPNQNWQGRQYPNPSKQEQWQPEPKYAGGGQPPMPPPPEKGPGAGQGQDSFSGQPGFSGGGAGFNQAGADKMQYGQEQCAQKPGAAGDEPDSDQPEWLDKLLGDVAKGVDKAVNADKNPVMTGLNAMSGMAETAGDFEKWDPSTHKGSIFDNGNAWMADVDGDGKMEMIDKETGVINNGGDDVLNEVGKNFTASTHGKTGGTASGIAQGTEGTEAPDKSDALYDMLMDYLGQSNEVLGPEERAAFEEMLAKETAQAKADLSQQMGARGMGAGGLVGAGFGNIDSQAISQLGDFDIQAAQLESENELNKMKTAGQMYGAVTGDEYRDKVLDFQGEQFEWDKEQKAYENFWNELTAELGLEGGQSMSEGEIAQKKKDANYKPVQFGDGAGGSSSEGASSPSGPAAPPEGGSWTTTSGMEVQRPPGMSEADFADLYSMVDKGGPFGGPDTWPSWAEQIPPAVFYNATQASKYQMLLAAWSGEDWTDHYQSVDDDDGSHLVDSDGNPVNPPSAGG